MLHCCHIHATIYSLHIDDKIVVKSLEHRRYEEFVLENNYIKAVKSGLVLEFKGAQCFMKEKSDSNILQIWKIENQCEIVHENFFSNC